MTRLRDAGNTLVVVEHDPQMVAADELLDLGPGPGSAGGDMFFDAPARMAGARFATADYLLAGTATSPPSRPPRPVDDRHAAAAAVRRASTT